MEDLRKINAAEYIFSRLKKNVNTKAIKLKTVAPIDISIHDINGIKLLEEHKLISFDERKRLIDKNVELWDSASKNDSLSDFLKGLNNKEEVVDKVVNNGIEEKVKKPRKKKEKVEEKEEVIVDEVIDKVEVEEEKIEKVEN